MMPALRKLLPPLVALVIILALWEGLTRALHIKTFELPPPSAIFLAALKNARVREKILYPEGGHIINLQRPEETARDAKAFLDRNVRP